MIPRKNRSVLLVLLTLLLALSVPASELFDDDYSAEPDARVARIRLIDGKAEIRRIDNEEWESAALNLPLVEGDEIRTLEGSRLEIQFDNDTYIRLDETSVVKLVSLGYEGVAVSISQGTLAISVLKFDQEKYLEVDAPRTTVAITREGKYRVDAGDEYEKRVEVSVWDGGTARVYTLDSGFTLKNDQSAMMNLDGPYEGKWEVARSSGDRDSFDEWAALRDSEINESLKDAYYDRYYDSDVYGADDLNDHGSWQYDNDYGYIWSPYDRSISVYDNWSPYRYGQWRWLPYYGWTWVNDEPWGWATYHYGRWIFLNGRWFWTPYSYSSYYPYRRSWWRPALVYIGYIGNRVCWYPLPYNYAYYDYNRRYRNRWKNYRRHSRTNDSPPPDRRTTSPDPMNVARGDRNRTPPLQRVPPGGVVVTGKDVFGTQKGRFDTAPPEISKQVLSKAPVVADSPPLLPTPVTVKTRETPGIIPADRKGVYPNRTVKIGATDRKAGEPLDKKLRDEKMRANRPPLITIPRVQPSEDRKLPRTGVFDRSKKADDTRRTVTPPLIRNSPSERKTTDAPVYRPTPKQEDRKPSPPVYRPAPKQVERKPSPPVYRPAPKQVERKPSPPVYRPAPKQVERKPSPPVSRPAPRRVESKPPPTKSSPPKTTTRRESKPAPKPPSVTKKPDS